MHKGNTPDRGGFPAGGWVEEEALRERSRQQTHSPAGHRIPVGGWVYSREHTPLPAGHRIPVGGWVYCRERSRTPPTHQQGTGSLLAGGFTLGSVRARLPTPPTHQQGTHPCQGCCPCARWAETNNPAVINKLLPPSRRWQVYDCGNRNDSHHFRSVL